jgi:hypothetical protein
MATLSWIPLEIPIKNSLFQWKESRAIFRWPQKQRLQVSTLWVFTTDEKEKSQDSILETLNDVCHWQQFTRQPTDGADWHLAVYYCFVALTVLVKYSAANYNEWLFVSIEK